MAEHNELGKWGEEQAREYLAGLGMAIYDGNSKIGSVEVDIIAFSPGRIHFVEVKTRSSDFVDPTDAVRSRKVARICRFADNFIRSYNIKQDPQFDVIAIIGSPQKGVIKLDYYPDAFMPPLNSGF